MNITKHRQNELHIVVVHIYVTRYVGVGRDYECWFFCWSTIVDSGLFRDEEERGGMFGVGDRDIALLLSLSSVCDRIWVRTGSGKLS